MVFPITGVVCYFACLGLLVRRLAVLLIGVPRGRRADVGCPVHERMESARPLQPPRRTDIRLLRYDGQEALTPCNSAPADRTPVCVLQPLAAPSHSVGNGHQFTGMTAGAP